MPAPPAAAAVTGVWWWAAVGLVLVVIAGVSGLARRGVWWRFAAVGVFVGAVAAVALAGPSDHYLYDVDRPSYPGYGRADPPEGTFVDLSASAFRTCGVRTGGEIECWGDDYGEPPAGRFVKVDVWEISGAGNGCAVAVDASVQCWSRFRSGHNLGVFGHDNDFGQDHAPAGSFVDVSVAERFSCGLRTGGEVVCWGDNTGHGFDRNGLRGAPGGALEVPGGPFAEVEAGRPPCGLRTRGEFVCWSSDAHDVLWQQGHPFWDERFVSVSPGWGFVYWRGPTYTTPTVYVCGIRLDSTLTCSYGGAPVGGFVKVDHSSGPPCALRTDGTILCWNPFRDPLWEVLLDPPRGEFTDIAVGAYHACAIRVDGTVACWGDNSDRPLPDPCPGADPCPLE